MSLITSLFTGVSGLSGNSQAMNVIGNNIANVNTVGFKGSSAVFSDVFGAILTNGPVTSQLGLGTRMQGILPSFAQGSFETTTNALDLAVDGSGFFIVNNGTGNFYTRAGQFRLNASGLVQTISGEILQGFQFTGGVPSTTLSDIDLSSAQSAPVASTEFTLGANLDADAPTGTTFTSPVTVFNSLGSQVTINVTFTKAAAVNTWDYTATSSLGTVTGGANGSVTFDSSGQLSLVKGGVAADIPITIDYGGTAATQIVNWDLVDASGVTNGDFTGFAATSVNNFVVQDGFTSGTLLALSVDNNGVINGLFNNGQSEALYQVALADFLAPTGLSRLGRNLFAESGQSGQPNIGTANTGRFGQVLGSSLELSNVDLATEFVKMIQTQQAFQASARVIITTDDLLTEAVNLVR